MEIIEKETKGKSYHTYKYSYDSIGLPSIDYDDDPNKIMKWKEPADKLSACEISKDDYDRWRYYYPKYDTTQLGAKVPCRS